MAAVVPGDWSIDATTGDIRYIGDDHGGASPSYVEVIELHRWAQDLADDESWSGDDEMDITILTPSDRSTDNIITLLDHSASGGPTFNIDAASSEHLFDGSIIQNSGDTIYDGIVNFGNVDKIQIIQDGAVISDDWWNLAAGGGLNSDSGAGISHRFMILVRDAGADIDGRRLVGTSRRWLYTSAEFGINGTSRGNNVLALSESSDLNNASTEAAVAAFTITNTNEGYIGLDISGDGSDEFYYSQWDLDVHDANDLYEYGKYLTREGSSETLYGLNGELFRGITHEIDIDTNTGTFVEPEAVSWSGGTGQLLAIDSTTAGTKMWIQLLTGTAPSDGDTITGGTSAATADVNLTVTERTVSYPFVGVSTGSSIIGAYGIGMDVTDTTASDQFFDLTNTQVVPPNNVTFTVSGVVSGEDRVLVGPEDGAGGLDVDQLSLSTTLSGAAETAIVVTAAIPSDTPATGTVRVQLDSGVYGRYEYTSYTGSTFTIASTDFTGDNATAANNVFISYIDVLATGSTESFTTVFDSSRTLFVRVRDGAASPIKTFETTGTLGSSGGGSTAIRTSDA